MASPLRQFENARILWQARGNRSSGRDGFEIAKGDAYLMRAFLKRRATNTMITDRLSLPAVNGQPLEFKGYCVRFAVLPADQIDSFTTIDLNTLTWDETALLPPGVKTDDRVKLYMPGYEMIDARFSNKEEGYGQEGIGALIRDVLGDPIYLEGGKVG